MSDEKPTYLPNLVGGVSIWKLGVDLNEPKFFDGRLLVPETEGSESLPVTVRWDLTGLVPLAEARAKHGADVDVAIKDFQDALDRVAKVFATAGSGYDKYKEAFTVPALEGGSNYFYSPTQKKLFVTNWGASPRSMGGTAEYVFGYQDWGKVWGKTSAFALAAAGTAGAAGTAAAAGAAAATAAPKNDDEKKEKEKNDEKKRPWWIWPLFALLAIALVLLALFLLKSCEEPKPTPSPDAALDAPSDVVLDAPIESGASDAAADGASDAAADAAADGGDAGKDGGTDAGDAGKDGGSDASAADDDDDDDGPGGSSGGGGGGGSSGGGAGGGKPVITVGPGGGAKSTVHRKHFHSDATKWRVTAGNAKVSRTEARGGRFDVWLTPGATFEGVRVEWQDAAGKWHVH